MKLTRQDILESAEELQELSDAGVTFNELTDIKHITNKRATAIGLAALGKFDKLIAQAFQEEDDC